MNKVAFRTPKPIIAMVHLQYSGSVERMERDALRDVGRLDRGGADGLLFENWGFDFYNMPHADWTIERILRKAHDISFLPYGFNILPLEYIPAFRLAASHGGAFVQVDTFVDTLGHSGKASLRPDPETMLRHKNTLGAANIALFSNIQSKHYETIPPDKPIEQSAREAVNWNADGIVVTGHATGVPPSKQRLLKVKKVAGDVPVLIGSGFDEGNAPDLLLYSDGVIVGTSIKERGDTNAPVDEARVRHLMEIVNTLR